MEPSDSENAEFVELYGARVSSRSDMTDDMLKFAIEHAAKALVSITDVNWLKKGDEATESLKQSLDQRYGTSWHVVIGPNFGSRVTHEFQTFAFFYIGVRTHWLGSRDFHLPNFDSE